MSEGPANFEAYRANRLERVIHNVREYAQQYIDDLYNGGIELLPDEERSSVNELVLLVVPTKEHFNAVNVDHVAEYLCERLNEDLWSVLPDYTMDTSGLAEEPAVLIIKKRGTI
jgi:hypothetical protein